MKKKARGVLTSKEFDCIEMALLGKDVLRAAYLAGSGVARAFADGTRAQLREARDIEEVKLRCVEAHQLAPHFRWLGLGGLSDKAELAKAALIVEKERELEQDSRAREARGEPSFYDRRRETWVSKSDWSPVPFVDLPDRQVFHLVAADLQP